ncbi:MAG: beta galactosidase jelly roll domain-containing protein [Acidobacteriota bacterium]|nr:beta galactosidase jelly roll domain-containing protein [Acidobacteriota bacterium]
MLIFIVFSFASLASAQGKKWIIQLEEPTGIERREAEVVRLEAAFAIGQVRSEQLRVIDSENREVPFQVAVSERHKDGTIKSAEVLFPATLIPGQLPRYTLIASQQITSERVPDARGGDYSTDILIRRLGMSRLELGNSRFRLIINLGKDTTTPAIVEAYNRTSEEHRTLNLVETTPDITEPLHFGVRSAGWGTALQGQSRTSGFTKVEMLESGPLRARVRLSGARLGTNVEEWEFEWYANSPVITWRTRTGAPNGNYGFFFSAVSAAPYEPFTHWMSGVEVGWPDGWETHNPPHKAITAQNFDDLPGRHLLYYNPKENYGALDFIEVDAALKWTGIGSRQFTAFKKLGLSEPQPTPEGISAIKRGKTLRALQQWSSQIGLCFPQWKGTETILEARADYRRFAQPILAHTLHPQPFAKLPRYILATRTPVYRISEEPIKSAQGRSSASVTLQLSLNGSWKLQHVEKGEGEKNQFFEARFDDAKWRTVEVPGSVHTQILNYPDYFSRAAEWISFKEWWYRKSFRVPAAMKGQRVRLQFESTDYYADIWLNGKRLGRHEGYIDPYEFEVGDGQSALDFEGDNILAVRVWTPVDYYWRHRPYTIKGSYGAVDQKPDNITALGITRPVRLVANGPVIIEDVSVRSSLNADGSADVEVEVSLDSAELQGQLELLLAPRNFAGRKELKATVDLKQAGVNLNTQPLRVRFHLEQPELWWTWDHGRPNLYTLQTRVTVGNHISDERSEAVGIREIEKVDWVFYLNGRRIFIRGTNSYYLELFMSEMTRQKYERDLRLMKDMNINMIRLHCHFQNPEFYELCDELGIMVWQDFLEAWYPRDIDFALQAAKLYDAHIRMVRNHPSIAIWATSDEEDLENYRVLTKHLAGRLYANDPEHRAVVRSTGRYGDGHIYHGWYSGNIWEYTKTEEKFISELGATALPNYETLMKFLPNHWPIEDHKEEWIFHKLQINEAMRAWGRPEGKTLKEYIPQTQKYVARLHQLAIERMRRRKYDAGGILHFHAIDFWPSVTMAALDYFRQPTQSYSTVQRSFQMVLASLDYDRDTWKVGEEFHCGLWVINDHWYEIPGVSVKWKIVDGRGAVITSGMKRMNIAEDSSNRLGEIRWKPASSGKFELRATVVDKSGKQLSENIYDFVVK